MTRRLLVIGLNYAPEPVGIGPYTTGLAEALAAAGYGVAAIVGEPYYPQWRRHPGLPRGWSRREEAAVTVIRCPHYIPRNPTGLRRIVHLASFALSALPVAVVRAVKDRPCVVVVIAPALPSVMTGWIAAKLSGARLWIHVQDFEAEAAIATGLVAPKGLVARAALWLERRLLGLGDRVSTISPQMVRRLIDKGIDADRVFELRNWSDPRFGADPAGAEALRAEWGIGPRKVALYSGNIARKQGIEILIEAAWCLRGRADIVFVICGEGPNRVNLAELAKGLPNVQLRDLQPAERMGAVLGLAAIHLLPQIAGAADLVLPSKLTNMLASGRPVVATAVAGTGLSDEVEGCGLVVPPGDPRAIAKAIGQLIDRPDLRSALGDAAQVRARERWGRDAILARFRGELERLAGLR